MMNNVVRQDGDEEYKNFLERMRMGELNRNDCLWMIGKCMDKLDP